jgi:hypothetical protein
LPEHADHVDLKTLLQVPLQHALELCQHFLLLQIQTHIPSHTHTDTYTQCHTLFCTHTDSKRHRLSLFHTYTHTHTPTHTDTNTHTAHRPCWGNHQKQSGFCPAVGVTRHHTFKNLLDVVARHVQLSDKTSAALKKVLMCRKESCWYNANWSKRDSLITALPVVSSSVPPTSVVYACPPTAESVMVLEQEENCTDPTERAWNRRLCVPN